MPTLTPRIVAYLGSEESLVQEAYKDSSKPPVWTWAIGIAETSGTNIQQYKDKPQPIEVCLRATVSMIEAKYLPMVERAFPAFQLSENQIAAALSFVWRNGTLRTQWVRDFNAGMNTLAQQEWLNWTNHGTEVDRAKRERDLFFNGTWPADLRVSVIPVSKPSYRPDFVHAKKVDVVPMLQQIMGGS